MKKKLILLIIIVMISTGLFAEAFSPVGTSVAQFLEIGVGPRATALGEAYTSLVAGGESAFWNPAGLVDCGKNGGFFASYTQWPADINIGGISMSKKLGMFGTLTISSVYLMTDEMKVTTAENPTGTGETFAISNYSFGISSSHYLTEKISAGITAKLVHENYFSDYGYSTWAIDIGTLYRTGYHGLNIGMSIMNFAPDVQFSGDFWNYSEDDTVRQKFDKFSLPMNFRFGLSMNVFENSMHKMTIAGDMIHPNDNSEQYNVGIEYTFNKMFALRSGYQLTDDSAGLSFGFGVKLSNFNVNYSFASMDKESELGNVHRYAIIMNF
ncbi:MAG: PorV/PorQ family protein [Candidatus Marinimicrobia bacterium]|nr:PorV/PorQ family protein [Candidatus Neomarinimicrobiota bacterium]